MMKNYIEQQEEEQVFNLNQIINILFRRKTFFIVGFLGVLIFSLIFHFQKPYVPIYRATFDITTSEPENPLQLPSIFSQNIGGGRGRQGNVLGLAATNILSLNLAKKIVDSLNLYVDIRYPDKDVDVSIKPHNIENLTRIIGPLTITFTDRDGFFEIRGSDDKKIGEGKVGESFSFDSFSFTIEKAKFKPNQFFKVYFYPPLETAVSVRQSINITVLQHEYPGISDKSGVPLSGKGVSKELLTPGKYPHLDLNILHVSVYWGNPEIANYIAQSMIKFLIEENIEEKKKQFTQSRAFIEKQAEKYEEDLRDLENKIINFKKRNNITYLPASIQPVVNRISELDAERAKIEITRTMLKKLSISLQQERVNDSVLNFAVTLLQDPILQSFYVDIIKERTNLTSLLKEYSENHPKVLQVKARLAGLKSQMKNQIQRSLSSIDTKVENLKEQINFLRGKFGNISENEIALARLERLKKTSEELSTYFKQKYEEARIQESAITSDFKVLNPPIVSTRPVNGRGTLKVLLFSLFLGLFFGFGLVFAIEYLDNTIKEPNVLRRQLELSILGNIPILQNNVRSVYDYDLTSPEYEAFRKLILNIQFSNPDKQYKTLYITSPGPEEGKTFITINLGILLGRSMKKILLIDADYRKKREHLGEVAKLEDRKNDNVKGLFDILQGSVKYNDVLHKKEDFYVLPTGTVPPNPPVFLESQRMIELIDDLKKEFDHIIIDGLPVLLFADASYFSSIIDGTILIAYYGRTNLKSMEESLNTVRDAGGDIMGVVINGVPRSRGTYYYYHYYRYYNKYYGDEKRSTLSKIWRNIKKRTRRK